MIQDKIFFDEKDPTGISYNTPFTVYGSYQGRLWSKTPTGTIKYYTQNSDLSVYATTGSNQFNGNQTVTGSLTVTGGITGTVTTASYVEYTGVANKPTLVSGSAQVSFNGITDKPTLVSGSSQITYSELSGIPSGIVSGSAQVTALGFATTGSNTFQANQTITGSLFITQNLVVAGSSSIQYISSSIVDIADNIVTVNAFNPGVRFGGLAVADSGSSPRVSGSILFDSIKDQWVFVHENQTVTTSSVILMGPETYNDLGNETYISTNRLPKGSGVEHLRDSNITDTGTAVSVNSNTAVTGSFTVVSGSAVELQVTNTGVNIGSISTDNHNVIGSLRVTGSMVVTGSGTFTSTVTAGGNFLTTADGGAGGLRLTLNNTGAGEVQYALLSGGSAGTGIFGIRNGATGTNLLLINGTGAATFTSSVTATSGTFTSGTNDNILGGGALGMLNYSAYNSSADQSITLGLGLVEAVNNNVAYRYILGVGGNASGQNLTLSSNRRGLSDLTILTVNGTNGAATFGSSVTSGGWISAPNNFGLEIRNAANTAGRVVIKLNTSNQIEIGNDTDISAIILGTTTERMRITSGGNVGIGTTSPTNRLHVASGDNEGIFMQGTNNGGHWFNFRSANSNLWSMGAQPGLMGWYNRTDSTYKMVITDGGNVGIGTTSPTTYSLNGRHFELNDAGGGYSFFHNNTTTVKSFYAINEASLLAALFTFSAHPLTFGTSNTERMRINTIGNVGIGTSSPISGGGDSKWITLDGNSYGGGFISSVSGTAKGYLYFDNGTATFAMQGASGVGVSFLTSNTERARITTGGNVLINNTSDDSSGAKLQVTGRISQSDYTYYRNRVAGNLTGATWINTGVTLTANNLGTYEVYVLGNENNQNQCLRIYYIYYNTNIGWTSLLASTHIQPTGNDYGVVNLRVTSGGVLEVQAYNSVSTGLYRIVVTKQFQN